MTRHSILIAVSLLLGVAPAFAQEEAPPAAAAAPVEAAPDEAPFVDVAIEEPFVREGAAATRGLNGATTKSPPGPVDPRRGYGTITYKIGEKADRDYYRKVIRAFVETLPQKFGNSEGTYTVTIVVKDVGGDELVREPILSFQWKKQSVFLVIDKVVEQLLETQWSGTLIDKVLVAEQTSKYKVGIVVYHSSARAMDFESLRRTSQLYTQGALAALLPLPLALTGMVSAVGDIVDLFYSGAKKNEWKETDELEINHEAYTESVPIKFTDGQGRTWRLPVTFTVSSRPSRYMSGAFDPGNVSVSLAGERNFLMVSAPDKEIRVSLLDLIRGSEAHPEARALLDAVAAKRKYEDGDVASECGALYGAISNYLSVADARALFWSFLKQNGTLIDEAACLSGGRREELEQVGLKP